MEEFFTFKYIFEIDLIGKILDNRISIFNTTNNK